MSIIESVFGFAEVFMVDPQHITINEEKLEEVADLIKSGERISFYKDKEDKEEIDFNVEIKLELLCSSINYCYWYGRSDVAPGGACSTLMYATVIDEFTNHNRIIDMKLLENIISKLSEHRFPLIEERAKHLVQTATRWDTFRMEMLKNKEEVKPLIDLMVKTFPGFARDMFLKRAVLFFTQLHRKFGWYSETIKDVPVPADYHLPNVLKYYGCLKYDSYLQDKIDNHDIITSWSLPECEIRAATILACKKLCELTEWTPPEIDTWLWTKKKECGTPFHLTITTDY